MSISIKPVACGLFLAAISLGSAVSAARVNPQFDTFGNLTTLSGGPVDFGGSGIATNPSAIANFTVGQDQIRVGIIATPRYSSPTLTNDGAGTYTAKAGESAPGLATWNFSFFAESSGNLAAAGVKLYYDLDKAVGNELVTMGSFDISSLMHLSPDPSVFQGSQNLGFGYLASGVQGVQAPAPVPEPFDPYASGEYSFRIGVDDGQFAAITVTVSAVPVPAGMPLLLSALGGLFWVRRAKSRTCP